MKISRTLLFSVALASGLFADSVQVQAANQERHEVQDENQNRFKKMGTDELLEKRGTMTSDHERQQLHNELMERQQTMTKEQKEKFSNRPENRTPKMKNQDDGRGMMKGNQKGKSPDKVSNEWGAQDQGNAYGQDQGMMQGRGHGKGGGKGGR